MAWLSCALLIIGLYIARVWHRHLHEKKLIGLREMIHTERMTVMEREGTWPESTTPEIETALCNGIASRREACGPNDATLRWVRFTALAIGLTGLFGGIGTMLGLYLVPDPDVQATWPLGVIPVFFGLGMLLFVLVSSRMAEPHNGRETS